jgi:peptide methionine sulfoxide reductase msrA/msrB
MKSMYIFFILIFLFGVLFFVQSISMSMDDSEFEFEIPDGSERATFAGGCFWCIEAALQDLDGVYEAISGYTGGEIKDPTYLLVSSGITQHVEAVRIYYDPEVISYAELVDAFLFSIDPTDDGGQFSDRGNSYRTALFYHDDQQKEIAQKALDDLESSGLYDTPLVIPLRAVSEFYSAELYHQDYYLKEPTDYKAYYKGSGREEFVDIISETKKINEERGISLTPYQYYITQKEGTEKAFDNEFWDTKDPGIYVDIVTGKPLFSSLDKYDSGTGWPSFTKPLVEEEIVKSIDTRLIVPRTQIKSTDGTNLGHVFEDGPEETGGERYCINSASLRFIHKDNLELEGYGEYLELFS